MGVFTILVHFLNFLSVRRGAYEAPACEFQKKVEYTEKSYTEGIWPWLVKRGLFVPQQ